MILFCMHPIIMELILVSLIIVEVNWKQLMKADDILDQHVNAKVSTNRVRQKR